MRSGTPREIEEVRRGGRLALAVAGSVDLSGGFAERDQWVTAASRRGETRWRWDRMRRDKEEDDEDVMMRRRERSTQAAGASGCTQMEERACWETVRMCQQ